MAFVDVLSDLGGDSYGNYSCSIDEGEKILKEAREPLIGRD